MLAEFTGVFAERLDRYTSPTIKVKQAEEGDAVLPDRILIAPGGRHLSLVGRSAPGAGRDLRRARGQRPQAVDRRAVPIGGAASTSRPPSAS